MERNLLSEEMSRITYLFKHERGVVISEQDALDKSRRLDVNLGVGKGSLTYTGRKEKSDELNNESGYFTKTYNTKFKDKQPTTPREKADLEGFTNSVNRILSQRNIIDVLLSSDEQKGLWQEIIDEDQYFAADTIKFVKPKKWIKSISFSKQSESTEKEENKEPFVSIDWVEGSTKDYFLDNYSDLTPKGKRDIEDNYIAPISSAIAEGQKTAKFLGGCIHYLKVLTSASRFKNTGIAADLSFLELSQKRNDTVYNYVIQRLKDIGITINCGPDTSIVRNSEGENGDGTSGPNPPGGDNSKGKPHNSKKEYDQYKFNRVYLGVGLNFEKKSIPTPGPESTKYKVEVYGRTKGRFIWRWKWGKFSNGKQVKSGFKQCWAYGRPK
jgi:hypothetical protein